MDAGRFLSGRNPAQAEVAVLRGDGDILDNDLVSAAVQTLYNPDSPLVGFQIVLLLAGQFAGVAPAAPLVIHIQTVIHYNVSF
jgi:hypothetical protein